MTPDLRVIDGEKHYTRQETRDIVAEIAMLHRECRPFDCRQWRKPGAPDHAATAEALCMLTDELRLLMPIASLARLNIDETHRAETFPDDPDADPHCYSCGEPWPCSMGMLIEALDREEHGEAFA